MTRKPPIAGAAIRSPRMSSRARTGSRSGAERGTAPTEKTNRTQEDPDMALRPGTKTLTKPPEADEPAPQILTQRKRPELGQYHLQVDRQTKRSYATPEAAEEAGAIIKKNFPIVQVVVYDTAKSQRKIIELPAE
jgi:hypothetical protein